MNYKEKAIILRVCSSKKGERCSRCPAFGQGSRNCFRNAMKDGATAITELIERAEKAERERDAAIADIKHIVCDLYEDGVLCKEFCKNHDGVCADKAELGLYEYCRGFEWRGVQEE